MIRFIFGLIYLILIVWCLVDLVSSKRSVEQKILWTIVILVFPIAGSIIYFLMSRKVIRF